MPDALIVGAGQAGASAALALRRYGFEGSIVLIGDEPVLPYEKPPLSKAYLAGHCESKALLLNPDRMWDENNIAIETGMRIDRVDPGAQRVFTTSGESRPYEVLIWACGGRARPLTCPGNELTGVHTIRSMADVDALRAELENAYRVSIIGAGFIGLEAASVLVEAGKHVEVIEVQSRVMARSTSEVVSQFFEQRHHCAGVAIRCNRQVMQLQADAAGKLNSVILDDGTILPTDVAIVGVGLLPNCEALEEAGARTANGVVVDANCRTSLQSIYAIGDCTVQSSRFSREQPVRLESVQNANDQAEIAARAICGLDRKPDPLPWFWSEQYEVRYQSAGLRGEGDTSLIRGSPKEDSFSVIHLRNGIVTAIECINASRDFIQGRKLVGGAIDMDSKDPSNPAVPLKDCLAEPA